MSSTSLVSDAQVKTLLTDANFAKCAKESIRDVAAWMLSHSDASSTITRVWLQVLNTPSTTATHKLSLLYVANEVLHHSRKRPSSFGSAFSSVLKDAFSATCNGNGSDAAASKSESELPEKLYKLVEVWRTKSILPDNVCEDLTSVIMTAFATFEPQTVVVSGPSAVVQIDGIPEGDTVVARLVRIAELYGRVRKCGDVSSESAARSKLIHAIKELETHEEHELRRVQKRARLSNSNSVSEDRQS
jgi:hypothetical protein